MNTRLSRHPGNSEQRGIAMIEALIALLVLSLGVLGLARLQMSALTESRNDMAERMQSNAIVRRTNPNPNPYVTGWGAPAAAGTDCRASVCNGNELAAFDLRAWKLNLGRLLPNGDAQVFRSGTDSNQFGVLVRWTELEGKNKALANQAEGALFTRADAVTDAAGAVGTGMANFTCPANFICHLVYIRP